MLTWVKPPRFSFAWHLGGRWHLVADGIQEVSGSIPLISTIEALKTIGFQGFFLFSRNFCCGVGNFLTQI